MTDHSFERDSSLASVAGGAAAVEAGAGGTYDQGVYESCLEVEVRSQWYYARKRFLRHRLAVASLVILIVILGAGLLAPWVAPYSFASSSGTALTSLTSRSPWSTTPGHATTAHRAIAITPVTRKERDSLGRQTRATATAATAVEKFKKTRARPRPAARPVPLTW